MCSGGFLFVEHPFFNVGVELRAPAVVTNPTLTAIQSAINAVAKQVWPGDDSSTLGLAAAELPSEN